MLVTQAFEKLASVVTKGSGLPALARHVLPHPLNPLPDERVIAITNEHLGAIVARLLDAGPR